MYLICNNIPMSIRNLIIGLLAIIGFVCSIYINVIFGGIFILGACIFAWKKTQKIGPDNRKFGEISWENVKEDKINIAKDNISQVKKIPKDKLSFLWLIPILIISIIIFMFLCNNEVFYLTFYVAVLFYSLMCSGGNDIWTPKILERAIKQQENIKVSEPWYIERSMEIAKGANVPLNMKTTLKNKNLNNDFLGVQVQTGVNNGPNGECSYSYCVILAKPEFDLINKYAKNSLKLKGVVIENATDSEVSVLVVRKDGYETNFKELQNLVNLSMNIVDNL